MGQWDSVKADVLAAIKANGRLARVVVSATTTPDADKPWNVVSDAPTYYPSEAGGIFACADVAIPNTTGTSAEGYPDKNCIIPGDVGVAVDMKMRVELLDGADAGQYTIKTMNTYAPDGVTIIGYKVRLTQWREKQT